MAGMLRFSLCGLLWVSLNLATVAQADVGADDSEPGRTASASETPAPPSQQPPKSKLAEDPSKGYYFLGPMYRHNFMPQFFLNLFLDESTGGNNPGGGLELTYRKDNFSVVTSLWWQGFMTKGPFLASGDPRTDTEIIDSQLSAVFLATSFLWSAPISDAVAFEYGMGVGIGLLLNDVIRNEAYPDDGEGSINGFSECNGPGDPPGTVTGDDNYCDLTSVGDGEDGGHYKVKARRWTNGGKVPNVVPWLAIPHLALRIKPARHFQMRIEGGFGLGFFAGGSLAYGF